MKNLVLSVFALFLCFTGSNAALWRVNNIPGVNANFTDLPAAYTAAAAGDTIYVEPSPNGYSAITLTKKLTIIGNGYFSSVTGLSTINSGLQANAQTTTINGMNFNPGSEFSTVMGCYMPGQVIIVASNITVKRNRIGASGYPLYLGNYHPVTALYLTLSNIDIRQNVIDYGITNTTFSTSTGGSISGVSIQNNIFLSTNSLPVGISGYMQNNMFVVSGTNTFYGFQFNNNIQIGGGFSANNNVYFNNIGSSTQFGTASGNQQNVTTATLFSNYANTTENKFILAPAGPGVGTGFGGVDCGIYGGPDPYKLSGIPPVPTIYSLTAPATTTSSTLSVTISTKSNN
jgi:hypothetical protein